MKNKDEVNALCIDSPLYKVWACMKQRCFNKNDSRYRWYGYRGITVCDEWLLFKPFAKWALSAGYKRGLELDRIDNDGSYGKENCRFVTHTVNIRNNSATKLTMSQANEIRKLYKIGNVYQRDLASMYGVSQTHISSIILNKSWR